MTLNELKVGKEAVVIEVLNYSSMKQRFIDIGFVRGARVECVLESPGKDPKAYMIKGAIIAIRNDDAKSIKIEVTYKNE